MNVSRDRISLRGSQSGAALIVVLLLLVIVTLLGMAAMRGAIMQERMASNLAARAISFQAAETGLRQAELIVRDGIVTIPSVGCTSGRCVNPGSGVPAWSASDFWDSGKTGYQTGEAVGAGISAVAPKFVIEEFGTDSLGAKTGGCIDLSKPCITSSTQTVYRITSQASTSNGAQVLLQSIYRR